ADTNSIDRGNRNKRSFGQAREQGLPLPAKFLNFARRRIERRDELAQVCTGDEGTWLAGLQDERREVLTLFQPVQVFTKFVEHRARENICALTGQIERQHLDIRFGRRGRIRGCVSYGGHLLLSCERIETDCCCMV